MKTNFKKGLIIFTLVGLLLTQYVFAVDGGFDPPGQIAPKPTVTTIEPTN